MDRNKKRSVYVSARQKKKLIELITKHPQLISCKVTQDFSYSDSRKLWFKIASECNSIPGARKTWRQWRKTWQDLRSNTKRRHAEANKEQNTETNRTLPSSIILLTQAEQEALGIKDVASISSCQEAEDGNNQESFKNGNTNMLFSDESESTPEEKVFGIPIDNNISNSSDNHYPTDNVHSSNCVFNCNVLAKQELRKIHIKEDYLNFKKEYLRQKLKLLKEQTEALKSIAKELCNK